MSEQTSPNQQQTVVIALVVIAVLLAAIVGVLIYQQTRTSIPEPTPASSTTPSQDPAASTGGTTGQGAPTAFDAKTATKVPAGTEPVDLVKAYNEDVLKGKFDEAFKMLPLDKQQSYGSASAYAEQVKAYGITSYEMGKPVTKGDTVEIAATQVTPQMPITYTWTFKKVGSQWYVASRVMGGTVTK